MGRQKVVAVSTVVFVSLGLSGCVFSTGAASGETTSSSVSSTPSASAEEADQETCVAFGDVLTINANADTGFRDGRMAQMEKDGWNMLGTRVLDRVPSRGEGDVSDALAALKEVAPVIGPGAVQEVKIGSDEWNGALGDMSDVCAEAGSELAISMFTGG
jgi:hypothetical protein